MVGVEGQGPNTSSVGGSKSVSVRSCRERLATVETPVGCYDVANSTLRGMPEVLDALPGGIQPVSEWIVSGADSEGDLPGVDALLLVRHTTEFEPMEIG